MHGNIIAFHVVFKVSLKSSSLKNANFPVVHHEHSSPWHFHVSMYYFQNHSWWSHLIAQKLANGIATILKSNLNDYTYKHMFPIHWLLYKFLGGCNNYIGRKGASKILWVLHATVVLCANRLALLLNFTLGHSFFVRAALKHVHNDDCIIYCSMYELQFGVHANSWPPP